MATRAKKTVRKRKPRKTTPTSSTTSTVRKRAIRRRRMQGDGKAWDWIKNAARKVGTFVKDNKVLSRGAAAFTPILGPGAAVASGVLGAVGLGEPKRRRRRARAVRK